MSPNPRRTAWPALLALALAACPAPPPLPPDEEPPPPVRTRPPVTFERTLTDRHPDPSVVEVDLEARVSTVELEAGNPIEAWTYDGGIPGPLLEATVGDRVIVHFTNNLPEPTTIHWHGLRITDDMDGVPHLQDPVQPGETFTYAFTVPDAGSFWYHPHMRSAEQIERGLYGPIVVHEKPEATPELDADRYFVLDDVRLTSAGEIAPPGGGMMDEMSGRYGNTFLVNGRAVPPSFSFRRNDVERWRLVNTANARTLEVGLTGATFRVIGTDGGLLPTPLEGLSRLELPVGARWELEVRYTADIASLYARIPYADGSDTTRYDVVPLIDGRSTGPGPGSPGRVPTYPAVTFPEVSASAPAHELAFDAYEGPAGLVFTINGVAWPEMDMWSAVAGAPVALRLVNRTMMEHPFHLHGNFFQVLERDGRAVDEPGLRDTVLVNGSETVLVGTNLENPGRWMYHCHINEHSGLGMMGEVAIER